MNRISIFTLKCMRHAYQKVFGLPSYQPIPLCDIEEGGRMIFNLLSEDKPCMIARYGANELNCILNYLEIKNENHSLLKNIKGESHDWWWNEGLKRNMYNNAGFFPVTDDNLAKFSEMMLEDSKIVDLLAIFPPIRRDVIKMKPYAPNGVSYFPMASYDSFLQKNPWTKILKGKRVLIVHPFAELIKSQYSKRLLLFENQEVLPNFQLITLKAVQSFGGVTEQGYSSWFEGLEWMKTEIEKQDFDIALIGCGAYGFPLAAHVKRIGHKAVHMGGSLQLLFGIKGKRWENPMYGTKYGLPEGSYSNILNNPVWVRPDQYRTNESNKVEDACYW